MAREPKYGVTITGWERLLAAFAANAQDFQHLEAYRVQLADALADLQEAMSLQTAFAASKQTESRRLQSLLSSGRKVASFLRHGVRRRYGDGSEKLSEFDLQSLRVRPRPEVVPPPPTEIQAPAATETKD